MRRCQFIAGEPIPPFDEPHDALYCGKPVVPGGSWCPEHRARVYAKEPRANVRATIAGTWTSARLPAREHAP